MWSGGVPVAEPVRHERRMRSAPQRPRGPVCRTTCWYLRCSRSECSSRPTLDAGAARWWCPHTDGRGKPLDAVHGTYRGSLGPSSRTRLRLTGDARTPRVPVSAGVRRAGPPVGPSVRPRTGPSLVLVGKQVSVVHVRRVRVGRDFVAAAPNRCWVADFTHVATRASVVYVAFGVRHLLPPDRRLVRRDVEGDAARPGHSGDDTVAARPTSISLCPGELMHHSDAVSQYTSQAGRPPGRGRHRGLDRICR